MMKSNITLPTKVRIIKAMVFPAVMYGCERWTIKKAECPTIDAFKLWCWRRLLRDPWTARRSNQSILKEINPEYSLEGLMLELKLQYFGHLMQRTDSLEKPLMLGKIEGRRIREKTEDEMVGWHHQLKGHESEQTPGVVDGQGSLACCSPWGHKELDMISNWTELILFWCSRYCFSFVLSSKVNKPDSWSSIFLKIALAIQAVLCLYTNF